jgi:rubrerythrin
MKKITSLIEVKLMTGVWGAKTAEHTKEYIREAIKSVKESAKTLETTVTTVSNEQVNVLAKGTEKQINVLAQKIRNCVITIDDIKIVD